MKSYAAGILLSVLAALAGLGCEEQEASRGVETKPDPAQIDQLRALGYVEFSPDPADPAKHGAEVIDRDRVMPGYRLYTSHRRCEAILIDIDGQEVHRWNRKPCELWDRAELISGGDLLVIAKYTLEETRKLGLDRKFRFLMRMNWEGEVLWTSPLWSHHDAEETPNGDILVLTHSERSDHSYGEKALVDNLVARLSADGAVLDSVSLYDVLRTNDAGFALDAVKPRGVVDLLHSNSIEMMTRPNLAAQHPLYGLDNVLVSSRHQDSIFIVDFVRKKLLWAWGKGEISGQHDAQVLENGNLLVFDNGLASQRSRVIEVDPRNEQIVWSYDGGSEGAFFTEGRGSSQRLANENTLVSVSNRGEAFEVTPDEKVVWRFRNPDVNDDGHRGIIIRMINYDAMEIEPLLTKTQ